jgi:hypothetical protein
MSPFSVSSHPQYIMLLLDLITEHRPAQLYCFTHGSSHCITPLLLLVFHPNYSYLYNTYTSLGLPEQEHGRSMLSNSGRYYQLTSQKGLVFISSTMRIPGFQFCFLLSYGRITLIKGVFLFVLNEFCTNCNGVFFFFGRISIWQVPNSCGNRCSCSWSRYVCERVTHNTLCFFL